MVRTGTYEREPTPQQSGRRRLMREPNEHFGTMTQQPARPAAGHESERGVDHVVLQIEASITAKRDWRGKLRSAELLEKWRREAIEQGAPEDAFARAVRELTSDNYYELSGIAYQDGLISGELLAKLTQRLDRIAAISQDFHPGSGETVRNLIHPSLYPYVHGESCPPDLEPLVPSDAGRKHGKLPTARGEASKTDRFGHCRVGVDEWSRYQWLPAEVDVDMDGSARVASYLNNAPQDPELLAALEQSFSQMLPLFERVVTPPGARHIVRLRGRRLQVIVKAANYELKPGQSYRGSWHVEGMRHEGIVAAGIVYYGVSASTRGGSLAFRRLRNRNVAGRGKIPEEVIGDSYGGPSITVRTSDQGWQSETGGDTSKSGEKQEENMEEGEDGEQGAKEAGEEEDEEEDEEEAKEEDEEGDDYIVPTGFVKPRFRLSGESVRTGSLWQVSYKSEEMPNHIELGAVDTPAGRVLVFKNSLLHRVQLLWNDSTAETAMRKVLVFWLVDPDRRIWSSADVPRQQWDNIRVILALTLHRQWRPCGKAQLSVPVVRLIADFAKQGFTHEEALQHRLSLMKERKYSQEAVNGEFTALIKREYSFCEH
uniref:DUF4246 domain-containing protein n=1 Tax=Alexandrium monilatum TaxID=311494 RepID=A0A7S4RQP4_9DINO